MKKISVFYLVAFFPISALAQYQNVDELMRTALGILLKVTTLMAPFAVGLFLWHMIKFIFASKDGSTDLSKHKDMMIWSGVTLFVMVGIWSLVGYVQGTIGLKDRAASSQLNTHLLPTEL